MELTTLTAISPIDGRYRGKCENLDRYFSEFALIRYRVKVEIEYFIALSATIEPLKAFDAKAFAKPLRDIYRNFSLDDARRIKEIESVTNHDVKAVEYFIKERFDALGLAPFKEFIHFGLTSQDINNTSVPMSVSDAIADIFRPTLGRLIDTLEEMAAKWADIPCLPRPTDSPPHRHASAKR